MNLLAFSIPSERKAIAPWSWLLLLLLWFVLIFGPLLDTPLGNFGDVAGLFCLLMLFKWRMFKTPDVVLVLLWILFAIIALALLNTLILDLDAMDVAQRAILRPFKTILFLLGVYSAVELSFNKLPHTMPPLEKFNQLALLVYTSLVVHGLIMVFEFLDPDFRNFVYSFTTAKYQLEFYQLYRMAGLSNAGGAQVSVIQSLGFVIGLYLTGALKVGRLILVGNSILALSVVLSGRSGLITIFVGLLVYGGMLFTALLDRAKRRAMLRRVTWLDWGVALAILAGGTQWIYANVIENENFNLAWRAVEALSSEGNKEIGKDETLDKMLNMFVLPEDPWHLLFGRSSYLEVNTFYGINTDIGYFHLIWGYGIVGMLIHLSFYLLILFYLWSRYKEHTDMRPAILLAMLLVALIVFFNSKELFFFARMSFQITMALFFAIVLCIRILKRGAER